jgi:phosphoribosylanthranilate isomerase
MQNIIQIAGIIDREEAQMLLSKGVDWLGFPLRLPVHREDISGEDAAKIITILESPAAGVLITYLHRADDILNLCRQLGVTRVQLHGDIVVFELQRLKELAPELFVIKSLIVKGDNLPQLEEQVNRLESIADAFITDTHNPATGADGATGKIHDWNISRRLVEISSKPVILAGGLNPQNVRRAILQVRPAGVDAHTGVENAAGRKDPAKVEKFVFEARAGFEDIKNILH